ncbi:MAG: sugar ABC transporter permease [Phycisphaerales bacterium]|nr:sugar ABC transporter permease [Phycisphaerales bacterium]
MTTGPARSLLTGLAWISPWLVGVALFTAVPAAMSLYYSLTDYTLLEGPVYIGLDNYRELGGDRLFGIAVRNTLVFAITASLSATVLSVLLAVLLEQRLRGAGLVRAIVFLPTLVPVVSACVCWLWLYNAQFGLFNSVLAAAGIDGPDWLGRRDLALPSLVFMSLWIIGSPLLVCSAALKDVPAALYEAADLDGISRLGRLRHVTLPMISPAILFNAIMSIIWSLQVFAPPQIMTGGGPENSTLVYSMYVYWNAFIYGRMGYASAMAWIQMLVALGLAGGVLGLSRRVIHYRAA